MSSQEAASSHFCAVEETCKPRLPVSDPAQLAANALSRFLPSAETAGPTEPEDLQEGPWTACPPRSITQKAGTKHTALTVDRIRARIQDEPEVGPDAAE
ncbi:hypothetical protein AAFF_G00201840 [Aldrovandia affinis]|uniref:Uncharacterized protein n=1 Tax=Aldrovandia affinis TaxID=143900 RepID=A0AAD7WV58_9TELE|nr:hypothetical protein AAFF_G00201840 [Aldrovandia affinis]